MVTNSTTRINTYDYFRFLLALMQKKNIKAFKRADLTNLLAEHLQDVYEYLSFRVRPDIHGFSHAIEEGLAYAMAAGWLRYEGRFGVYVLELDDQDIPNFLKASVAEELKLVSEQIVQKLQLP